MLESGGTRQSAQLASQTLATVLWILYQRYIWRHYRITSLYIVSLSQHIYILHNAFSLLSAATSKKRHERHHRHRQHLRHINSYYLAKIDTALMHLQQHQGSAACFGELLPSEI